jgi:heme oxygenase
MLTPLTSESIVASVKLFTSNAHQELEALIVPKLSSIQSQDDYHSLLKCFYGYFKPVENVIEQFIDKNILPDIKQRRKATLILKDLDDSDDDVLLCQDLPEINNTATALGAMYVLEGSTLGGRGITKMLLKTGIFPSSQIQFFNGYGEHTGKMWVSFQNCLNEYCYKQGEAEETLQTANDTFVYFKNWVLKTLY